MPMRSIMLIVIAVLVAGGTAMMVRGKLKGEDAVSAITGSVKVLAAAGKIEAGKFVRAGKELDWITLSSGEMKPDYIKASEVKNIEEFNGAVARRNFNEDDPISRKDLVRSNEGGFMSAVLNPGMRAVSIPVNATSGNAGFIFPGDRVDLIVTHEIKKGAGGREKALASETFVENIRVVAIDQMLSNPDNKAVLAKTVTLEVSSKEAEMINVADKLGDISIALRSYENDAAQNGDKHSTITRDSDVSRLLNTDAGVQTRVNVTRGNETQQIEFQSKGTGQ